MSENLENYKKKEERIKQYFYEYNQSFRELILSGEDANSLLFHDFLKDLKPDEINLLKKNTFPSIARLNVLNAIYSVSILSVEDRRLLKEVFIRPNESDWWKQYYTRSNYYRSRHRVVNAFYGLIN